MADDFTDLPANSSTSGRILPGGTLSGNFHSRSDQDWIKIPLATGELVYYVLDMELADMHTVPDIEMRYPDGTFVPKVRTVKGANGVYYQAYKATAAGDYFVVLGNHGSSRTEQADYTLHAISVPDDVPDNLAGAHVMEVGQRVAGTFEDSIDADIYKIELAAGVTYKLAIHWPNTHSSSGMLSISSPSGNGVTLGSPQVQADGSREYSFLAASAGAYSIWTRAGWAGALISLADINDGPYTLQVSATGDDYAANAAGAGTLVVGGAAVKGALEVVNDRDWYRVELQAGGTYQFTVGAAVLRSASLITLFNSEGVQVAQLRDSKELSPVLQYAAAASGVYYLEVADTWGTGNYTVKATGVAPDDHGDSAATATLLQAGAQVNGRLGIATDRDVFRIPMTAGQTYQLELKAQTSSSEAKLALSVNGAGNAYAEVRTFYQPGATLYQSVTPSASGDYFVTLDNTTDIGTATYTLKASTAMADDFAASRDTQGTVAEGNMVHGTLDYKGDMDWFHVSVKAGASYVFELRGDSGSALPLAYGGAFLGMYTASGTYNSMQSEAQQYGAVYTYRHDTGGDFWLAVLPVQSSTASAPAALGAYTLRMTDVSADKTAPGIVSASPAGYAGLTGKMTVAFNESIRPVHTGSFTLKDEHGMPATTFQMNSGALKFDGDHLEFPYPVLRPGAQYSVEFSPGSVCDLAGNASTAALATSFSTVAAVAQGGQGNDYLIGTASGARLNGNGGTDTAWYDGYSANYHVVRHDAGATVSNAGDTASGDTLTGIERLMFRDTSVALDIDGNGGQAYRLYQAAFNRQPDAGGLGYWIAQLDHGLTLAGAAADFIASAEFRQRYGANLTNAKFVDQLYLNVLHRAGESGGVAYWNTVLDKGAARGDVLMAFSESAENQTAMLTIIGNGFNYMPYS